ncbi:hypothetical protein NA655_03440 [Pseudomonas kuykendallii]|uniref:hypothetical protein n=1 Tax=Pseudomonas kuykendallii TaxID=1007099 RepID=UPI0011143085|nr:hypothetical protein [Pseudomonas kuykendallii]MCQ4270070.1 hypothetical protein [Pseudomonas kuykendallii]
MNPIENYGELMWKIRSRFDVIEALRQSDSDPFSRAESAAFHGRKIVEAIAFACLVAVNNGLKIIPRDAKGQWNAEAIFKNLKSKNITALPSPSNIRQATLEEQMTDGVNVIIEGIPEKRLTTEELIEIYKRLHVWLHELNPYSYQGHSEFYTQKSGTLWADLEKLHLFIERHFISIRGTAFFCVLRDTQDRETKVIPLAKQEA